jgi:FAD/FMN-containing dehydrogenase
VVLDEVSPDGAGQDDGQLVFERPVAVLRPGSIDDVARTLRFARRHHVRVVGRGAGHTTFGQSQHAAGIAFDLTTLDSIGRSRQLISAAPRNASPAMSPRSRYSSSNSLKALVPGV